jgi:phosphate transport system protein
VNGHIVKAFSEELATLGHKIAAMGGLAERELADAVTSIERRDLALAGRTVAADLEIDEAGRDIEAQAILMIARRQPVASDLREIIVAVKIATDLERVGDLAKNIARRAERIIENHPQRAMSGFVRMARAAMQQIKDVLDAYSSRDTQKALAVWRADEEIDSIYNSLFRELLTYMMEDPRNIGSCTHLLFGAKNIERIGDHATNIAENIYYLVEGEPLSESRLRLDDTETGRPARPVDADRSA